MMARDPYPWMSIEEVLDRLHDELDTCEDSADFSEAQAQRLVHESAHAIDQDGAFGHAYTAAALTKAIFLLSQLSDADPLGEALNSDDGVYRP